jgi:predicted nucleic acid-binding protein
MASRDKVFLDTDVLLDHLADRQPFAEYAHRLLALAETGELTLCASSLSFSNLYYILRKLNGHADALALLGKLKLLVHVSVVTDAEVQAALASNFKDFEDGVQHFAAKAEGTSAQSSRGTRPTTPPARFRCYHRTSFSPS